MGRHQAPTIAENEELGVAVGPGTGDEVAQRTPPVDQHRYLMAPDTLDRHREEPVGARQLLDQVVAEGHGSDGSGGVRPRSHA